MQPAKLEMRILVNVYDVSVLMGLLDLEVPPGPHRILLVLRAYVTVTHHSLATSPWLHAK